MNFTALWELSPAAETLLRSGYGALLTAQLLLTLPQARRFFCSERYGGYHESSRFADALHRPAVIVPVMIVWLLAAIGLIAGIAPLACAAVAFAFARYFFVQTRWKSILRGMGAPGHMNHWLAALVFFLALARAIDGGGTLRAVTVLTFRVDFALIMIAAGIYKITAGYARGDGFERGLVNPYWGRFARRLAAVPPQSGAFRALNHAGYVAEIACGALFLVPAAAPYAAILLGLSFLGIGAVVRLGFLAEMVAVACVVAIPPGNGIDDAIARIVPAAAGAASPSTWGHAVAMATCAVLLTYLASLPLAYAGMGLNFYGKRRLPALLQTSLDRWTGCFGLILWRVFTHDVINFYATLTFRDRATGAERPYLIVKPFHRATGWRYMHVGEFICLASIFTTLKYYPGDPDLFRERLLRYAKTVPTPEHTDLVFGYTSIRRSNGRFVSDRVAEFIVDAAGGHVAERRLDPGFDVRAKEDGSPIHPGLRPGSYAPVG